jgi:rhamnose transport system permease protein
MSAQTEAPTVPAAPDRGSRRSGRQLVDAVVRLRELGLIVALAVLIGVTGLIEPRFVGVDSLRDLVLNVAIIVLVAVGQTLVIVTRNIDLSVGSTLGLAAFLAGDIFRAHPGASIPLVFVLGIAMGGIAGLVNGVLVTWGRIPSLVTTLGTMYVFRGLAFVWTNGTQVNAETLPDDFLHLGSGLTLGIPTLVIIAVVVAAIVGVAMRDLRSGRELYAIGSNPDAARLAGIRIDWRVTQAFVACGALAGLAGVCFTARYGTVDATAGTGYELDVIAAAVVGGVAIFGGTGNVFGAALGALLLGTITSSLVVLKVPSFWQQAIVGALLLAAIALDRFVAVRVTALLRQRSSRRAE